MHRQSLQSAADLRWYKSDQKPWLDCTSCPLQENRNKVCLFRGKVPADIVYVGEAPGHSEDTSGYPFVGPAGRLLDDLLQEGWHRLESNYGAWRTDHRECFANILGCIPYYVDKSKHLDRSRVRAPAAKEARACQPRLLNLLQHCKPRLIVLLGQSTAKRFPSNEILKINSCGQAEIVSLQHPAAILRSDAKDYAVSYKRFYLTLERAIVKAFGYQPTDDCPF